MKKNNNIFEINTRVWLKRFKSSNGNTTLKDVPLDYWKHLKELGMDYVWLMGVWKTNESVVKDYCFEPGLVDDYKRALKDFTEEDVIGSPYSIDSYEVNPNIGTKEELFELKKALNSLGIKLILDFVSNHFSVHSTLLKSKPELFLSAGEEFYQRDSHTYFKSKYHENKYFAHGRDPFFPSWLDTVQVNYFNPATRAFMIETLKDLTNICDGLRCDMAMLSLNNVFDNTWSGLLTYGKFKKPSVEYWEECISEIKKIKEDFLFIGEAYWDLEWELQRLGFDYTYDKKLLDRLKLGQISEIKAHLLAENEFQNKSVRFLENHDEDRAINSLGSDKAKAAAVVVSTIQGMRLFYDGQFEGKKIKLPVQLGREPKENENECISKLYETLFRITNDEIFRTGYWDLVETLSVWEGNKTFNNFLVWNLTDGERKRLVVVNYSREVSQCRIKLNLQNYPEKFKLKDLLNEKTYYRKTEEVISEGLFVELGPYKSHIFSF
ncbi:glycosidase [Candidatus Woesearchaeota archaeon]|nr:glycosidase [Candidatus Woesearchaeota archaeon]